LVDAQTRGVDVRVVLDRTNKLPTPTAAYTVLHNGLTSGHLTICSANGHGSCIGNGINHNKFYLFSQLSDGSTDVVVQSSANLTTSQMKQHNNMIVSRGDHALYSGYLDYWNDLKAQHKNLNYYRTIVGDYRTRTYAFPRASGDTIISILNNVHCHAGASTLLVNMAFFADNRIDVAHKLVEKHNQGCSVKANLRDDGTASAPGASVLHTLKHGGVSVRLFAPDADHDQFTIHSKILLVDSAYEGASGVSHRKLVFMGSHNYTDGALQHNDETLMRIDDPGIFAAYLANWNTIRSLAP
ncbi:MAG TPA: phospholipase D-like domain-containing protein, partial [Myxococcota bacterium]